MVGLHSLQGMDKLTATFEVECLILSLDRPLNFATGPERMVHGTPRILMICAIVCCPILSNNETWSGSGKGEVDDTILVNSGLNSIGISLFVQSNRQIISTKRKQVLIEHVIV